jgi:hypothetical protein
LLFFRVNLNFSASPPSHTVLVLKRGLVLSYIVMSDMPQPPIPSYTETLCNVALGIVEHICFGIICLYNKLFLKLYTIEQIFRRSVFNNVNRTCHTLHHLTFHMEGNLTCNLKLKPDWKQNSHNFL